MTGADWDGGGGGEGEGEVGGRVLIILYFFRIEWL